MYHAERRYLIHDVPDLATLATRIAADNETLCFGARCQGLLVLNDSITSDPDRNRVYAVVVDGRQIESLTTNGCSAEVLLRDLESIVADPAGQLDMGLAPVFEHLASEHCSHCA